MNWEPRGAGGRNYGWRLREGRADYDTRQPAAYQPLTEPIHDYPRSDGMSVTGGFVYRGSALHPMFNGRYFFADFVAGRVYSIGLSLNEQQEATAVDLLELTELLGGTAGARADQFIRRRCRRRVVYRQLFSRPDPQDRAVTRPCTSPKFALIGTADYRYAEDR